MLCGASVVTRKGTVVTAFHNGTVHVGNEIYALFFTHHSFLRGKKNLVCSSLFFHLRYADIPVEDI